MLNHLRYPQRASSKSRYQGASCSKATTEQIPSFDFAVTRVYDVPGTQLTVSIEGMAAFPPHPNAKGTVDVLIYGQY